MDIKKLGSILAACFVAVVIGVGVLMVIHQSDVLRGANYRYCIEHVVIDASNCKAP